jgi:hypothetical protein
MPVYPGARWLIVNSSLMRLMSWRTIVDRRSRTADVCVEDLELGGAAEEVDAVAPATGTAKGHTYAAEVVQGVGELRLIHFAVDAGP